MQLNFNISFLDLYSRDGLIKLDQVFLHYIKSHNEDLFYSLSVARKEKVGDSQLIIDLSYLLDEFITKLFNIAREVEQLQKKHGDFAVVYKCKRLFVQRYALKKYADAAIDVDYVIGKLGRFFTSDRKFAEQVMYWFENKEKYEDEVELAAQYAAWRVKNKGSILFSVHRKIDHENLVSFSKKEVDEVEVLYSEEIKGRCGFDLTSEKTSLDKALDNVNYCIFCHKQNKDSCAKGLNTTTTTFKKSPLAVELHGCPLEQKISEMNMVKSEGYSIAGLAIVMIDNPLCAATGNRICNDCMNSCIYQRQEPVNVPMIETKILDDVLDLPYGFEIYSLLSRWNPLNFQRPLPKENTGKSVLVVGLGPAGFNLAYHLLNDGHNVVAIDGLKIEPLIDDFQPIKNFKYEKLSERIAGGFGGVAEYGITSRWDKNYLKIIRLLLQRCKNFALYGGVRFGGTITVNDTFDLGFDHIALALGSGKPRMIKIKNMLANMASDFLMSLQLTGALRSDSIANLQVRMPVVVIGAGLTAIDTATEALAYYPVQVEKFLSRYEILIDKYGKDYVERNWTDEEREIADEFISHAKLIREIAKEEGRERKTVKLMQNLGGVKVVYRKELRDSPGYRLNSEEVQNALSEGVYFIENLEPIEIIADKYNNAEYLKLVNKKSGEIKHIKARSIFIAAGTEPNTVIATEDREHFKLKDGYFTHLDSSGKEVEQIFSPKMQNKDRILAYKQGHKAISFFGDLHPSYSGSVVKAMASAKNGYPIISQLLSEISDKKTKSSEEFFAKIKEQLTAKVIQVQYLTDTVVEIVIKAPLAAKNFQPGQFFRLQNFEVNGENTQLAMEGIAVTGTEVDKEKGIISTIVLETGGSTNLCKYLKEGELIILMGPTGSPTEI